MTSFGWIEITRDGRRVAIDEAVPGFERLWSAAREILPGLGSADRSADIAAGDWQDSVTIWTLHGTEAGQPR